MDQDPFYPSYSGYLQVGNGLWDKNRTYCLLNMPITPIRKPDPLNLLMEVEAAVYSECLHRSLA